RKRPVLRTGRRQELERRADGVVCVLAPRRAPLERGEQATEPIRPCRRDEPRIIVTLHNTHYAYYARVVAPWFLPRCRHAVLAATPASREPIPHRYAGCPGRPGPCAPPASGPAAGLRSRRFPNIRAPARNGLASRRRCRACIDSRPA